VGTELPPDVLERVVARYDVLGKPDTLSDETDRRMRFMLHVGDGPEAAYNGQAAIRAEYERDDIGDALLGGGKRGQRLRTSLALFPPFATLRSVPSWRAPGDEARGRNSVVSMPDLVDRIRREIDSRLEELRPLAREASDLQRALDALNGVPAEAERRGRRPQPRRLTASQPSRPARRDIGTVVVEYVTANPGSTARSVADALGLKRSSVATRLTELAKRGDLVKAPRGYSTP
jgi:hypothetical protein